MRRGSILAFEDHSDKDAQRVAYEAPDTRRVFKKAGPTGGVFPSHRKDQTTGFLGGAPNLIRWHISGIRLTSMGSFENQGAILPRIVRLPRRPLLSHVAKIILAAPVCFESILAHNENQPRTRNDPHRGLSRDSMRVVLNWQDTRPNQFSTLKLQSCIVTGLWRPRRAVSNR
jgi:hypothetical protein